MRDMAAQHLHGLHQCYYQKSSVQDKETKHNSNSSETLQCHPPTDNNGPYLTKEYIQETQLQYTYRRKDKPHRLHPTLREADPTWTQCNL